MEDIRGSSSSITERSVRLIAARFRGGLGVDVAGNPFSRWGLLSERTSGLPGPFIAFFFSSVIFTHYDGVVRRCQDFQLRKKDLHLRFIRSILIFMFYNPLFLEIQEDGKEI